MGPHHSVLKFFTFCMCVLDISLLKLCSVAIATSAVYICPRELKIEHLYEMNLYYLYDAIFSWYDT